MFTIFASKDEMHAEMQATKVKLLQSFLATSVAQRLGGLGHILEKLNHDYVHAAAEHALDTEFSCTEVSYAVKSVSCWLAVAPNPQILDCCDESETVCRICNEKIKFEELFPWCESCPAHAHCMSNKLFEDSCCPVCKKNDVFILGFEPFPGCPIYKLTEILNSLRATDKEEEEEEESVTSDT